jgi:hypothetical protein
MIARSFMAAFLAVLVFGCAIYGARVVVTPVERCRL